ncbi:MAG: hypothetical protein ACFB51_12025 [Anaerolineae bacterium]
MVALIRDDEQAVGRVFDFVGQRRDLSTAFIRQLHQPLIDLFDRSQKRRGLGVSQEAIQADRTATALIEDAVNRIKQG